MFLNYLHDKKIQCWAGRLFCNVNVDGIVMPCGEFYDYSNISKYKSYFEVGFKNAFNLFNKGECQSCIKSCFIELNAILSLNLDSLYNWYNILKK